MKMRPRNCEGNRHNNSIVPSLLFLNFSLTHCILKTQSTPDIPGCCANEKRYSLGLRAAGVEGIEESEHIEDIKRSVPCEICAEISGVEEIEIAEHIEDIERAIARNIR